MAVKVLTDSTSDLPPEVTQALGITVVPLYVHFGQEAYLDGVEISSQEFYQKLQQNRVLPITAAPAPQTFAQCYDKLGENGDDVIAIILSSKLSATYESALEGKAMMHTKARVEIIDSLWATLGLGVLVIAVARAASEGATLEELTRFTEEAKKRVDFKMVFDTLEYLRRGGRLGTAQWLMGSLLRVHPILTIKDGLVEGIGRARSREKAKDYLIEHFRTIPNIQDMLIGDATTPDEADELEKRLEGLCPPEHIYRAKVGSVVGTHVGPHVLGIAVLPEV